MNFDYISDDCLLVLPMTMDLEKIRLIECKGCLKKFGPNIIRRHLANTSCKKEYSLEDLEELERIYDSYRKNQQKMNYKKKITKAVKLL